MNNPKFRAYLIKENKMVVPSTINYNRGYGGALEIFVDNPLFDAYRDIIEKPDSDVKPFFSYINHSLDVHKKRNNGDDFILDQFTGAESNNGMKSVEIFSGDILHNASVNSYSVVVYNNDKARWDVRYSDEQRISLSDAIGNLDTVVGNIHFNKNLLK